VKEGNHKGHEGRTKVGFLLHLAVVGLPRFARNVSKEALDRIFWFRRDTR